MGLIELFGKYFLAPLVAVIIGNYLAGRIIWKWQKIREIRYRIFEDAARAIALHCVDSLDLELQRDKPSYEGKSAAIYLRPETNELIQKTTHMVRAYFSNEAYESFLEAANYPIKINTNPDIKASQLDENAISTLIKELDLKWTSGCPLIQKLRR